VQSLGQFNFHHGIDHEIGYLRPSTVPMQL